jgi:hypothetical protein
LEAPNEILLPAINEVLPVISNEENAKATSSPPPCIALSPDLPLLDDDPVLLSIESPQVPVTETLDIIPLDYIIIVPCSDDEDDLDDDQTNVIRNNTIKNDTDIKVIESSSSLLESNTSPTVINPSLTRGNLLLLF